jgi:hypothetical protein
MSALYDAPVALTVAVILESGKDHWKGGLGILRPTACGLQGECKAPRSVRRVNGAMLRRAADLATAALEWRGYRRTNYPTSGYREPSPEGLLTAMMRQSPRGGLASRQRLMVS